MRYPENYKGRHGFTLVELMVVMAILMILISLLLPSVSRALHRARTIQCMGNLRKIITAAHMYADDHGDRFPLAGQWAQHYGGTSWANSRSVQDGVLFPYLDRNTSTYLCPEFVQIYKLQPALSHLTAHFSYSMNEYFSGGGLHDFRATRATTIAPSELGLFAEENPFKTDYNTGIINDPMLGVGKYGTNSHMDAIGSFHNPLSDNLSTGNGHGNVAFADGSVRLEHSKDSKEIFTPEIIKRRFR